MTGPMDLNDLIVSIDGLESAEIEDIARRLYGEIYVTSGRYGICKAHDGESVYFWEDRFEHAFYTSSNRIRYPDRKDRLDLERVKRIRWIKEIIAGRIPGTACWLTPSPSGGGRPLNRLYVLLSDSYVIWLEPRHSGGWKFSTAYKARLKDVQRYCSLGKRIWVQK
jgi:hypothetical protein